MEETKIIKQEKETIKITESQVALIRNTVAKGATDDELQLFFFECKRRNVHPLDRLIYFVKRGGDDDTRVAFQCGIDFMRSQAEMSGEYRGQDDVVFGPIVPLKNHPNISIPEYATACVKRQDPKTEEIIKITATAYWDEFYPGEKLGFMWRKMPRLMLGKTAEAQALRKGFPRQIGGLYGFEEMEQANIIDTNKPPIQPPQARTDNLTEERTTHIKEVIVKSGHKDGKAWKKYIINAGNKEYNTFSQSIATEAQKAQEIGLQARIEYKVTNFGNDIITLVAIEPTDEELKDTQKKNNV